jgi:hypothetical protein
MSRIYSPPSLATQTTRVRDTPTQRAVHTSPSNRRHSSATGTTVGQSDPLRLVKTGGTNPLSEKARQTLNLLEPQNEWRREKRQEAARGVQTNVVGDNSWEQSLSRWKTRRRSEPFYQPKVLDLAAPTSDVISVNARNTTSPLSAPISFSNKMSHLTTHDDDDDTPDVFVSKTSQSTDSQDVSNRKISASSSGVTSVGDDDDDGDDGGTVRCNKSHRQTEDTLPQTEVPDSPPPPPLPTAPPPSLDTWTTSFNTGRQ